MFLQTLITSEWWFLYFSILSTQKKAETVFVKYLFDSISFNFLFEFPRHIFFRNKLSNMSVSDRFQTMTVTVWLESRISCTLSVWANQQQSKHKRFSQFVVYHRHFINYSLGGWNNWTVGYKHTHHRIVTISYKSNDESDTFSTRTLSIKTNLVSQSVKILHSTIITEIES